MNICIFAKSTLAHRMGGMEIHGDELGRGLAARDHRVVVITTRHPEGLVADDKEGVETHYLPGSPAARYSRPWWRESVARFLELAKERPFDVVLSQSVAAYGYCRGGRTTRRLPVVAVMHGTPRGELRSAWGQVRTPRDASAFVLKTLPDVLLRFVPWFRVTLRVAEVIVTVSPQLARDLEREFPSATGKLATVLIGIDTGLFRPDARRRIATRERFGIGAGETLVLMAGRLDKQKGMDDGLRAFARARSALGRGRLMVVGDGPFRATLQGLARRLGIDGDVRFTGPAASPEMPGYYNACDLLLNPTRRVEGLPLVIAEAMACGRPVLSTRIGGIPSVIDDGIEGFLVSPGDVQTMTSKLLALLGGEERRAAMGAHARRRAEADLDLQRMIDASLAILERVAR